jgi:MYXO-CTERM domain-containing protein
MRHHRHHQWIAGLLTISYAAVAWALPGGITGASGKSGSFCNRCHSGGATPTVTLQGPQMLATGATATYTLTIKGGAAAAGGLDAALDDAALAAGAHLSTVSPMTQLTNGEVTHTQPIAFANGTLTLQFAVTAATAPRVMTLYAAGNSTNHDGTKLGDQAAATTLTITVAGPPPPPPGDLASAPPADLAGATEPDAGASDLASAPTPSGRDLATPAGGPGSAGPPAAPSSGGCSAAPGGVDDSAWALAAAAALVLVALRSRRRALPWCAAPARPACAASARAPARR